VELEEFLRQEAPLPMKKREDAKVEKDGEKDSVAAEEIPSPFQVVGDDLDGGVVLETADKAFFQVVSWKKERNMAKKKAIKEEGAKEDEKEAEAKGTERLETFHTSMAGTRDLSSMQFN
jgi:hypothetical protein